MKEEWLFTGAVVPVDVETTAALVAEIKRLIDVVGGLILKQGPDYERGFIDGMQKQMQSSVDKAVNALAQPQQEQDGCPVCGSDVHDRDALDKAEREIERLNALVAQPQQEPVAEQCQYGQEPKSCTSNPMDCQCAIDAVLAQEEPVAWKNAAIRLGEELSSVGPEFFTHNVEQPYDWSEWVCPNPKGYLMKCCDCGLVHEAEFDVVRYKSETEREDCEPVEDPNLQAVFRMRRSERWSPEDTAHRAGGLPMEQQAQQYNATSDHQLMENAQGDLERIKLVQTGVGIGKPQQEPVAWLHTKIDYVVVLHRPADLDRHPDRWEALYKTPSPCPTCEALARTVMLDQTSHDTAPPQRTWVGLTEDERNHIWYTVGNSDAHGDVDGWSGRDVMNAIETKLKEKNHG